MKIALRIFNGLSFLDVLLINVRIHPMHVDMKKDSFFYFYPNGMRKFLESSSSRLCIQSQMQFCFRIHLTYRIQTNCVLRPIYSP